MEVTVIPDVRQNVLLGINSVLKTESAYYDSKWRIFRVVFIPKEIGTFLVRFRTYNNVSNVVVRKSVIVVPEIGEVKILIAGCSVVGLPLRFVVLINGTLPKQNSQYLFHWHFLGSDVNLSSYTTVPIFETVPPELAMNYTLTVTVSNEVSSQSSSVNGEIFDSLEIPCLHHKSTFETGEIVKFYMMGFQPMHKPKNVTVKLKLEESDLLVSMPSVWISDFYGNNSALKWRYFSESSGIHKVIGLLFLQSSDTTFFNLLSAFQVVRRLANVRIHAPKRIYNSRLPTVTFNALVKPYSHGSVFYWRITNQEYVTGVPQLILHRLPPPGSYRLELEVRNAISSVNSSMVFEVTFSLLLLNFTHTNFFSGQNGSFSIEINQPIPPSFVFVDFGDNSFYDSRLESAALVFIPNNDSSVLTLTHAYKYFGIYDVFLNISNSVSNVEHWTTVVVEERISGIELFLMGSSVVALLEDVSVTCTVEKGTNLDFEWDFGDGSDGQYTREDEIQINGSQTSITAHHSYGIASTYNVSVHIFNNYQHIIEYLSLPIQAVEPIEQLHLQPRVRGQFATPIYYKKLPEDDSFKVQTTAPVEFEAWVWRGSDVQFQFNFGDGNIKNVSSQLNAWSLPYALAKHVYHAEGIYEISVTATNLMSSVRQSLEQDFYVQFPPENLMLDKHYYIIEHDCNLTLYASITQGTNVSFNWKVGDIQMSDAGNSIFLPQLNPGIHVVFVEAFNQVTDFGYMAVKRPNATAKIYVQDKLLDIQICIKTNSVHSCELEIIDLPLDEEVQFIAEVVPSTETALRFIWQLGAEDIRRTNVPFFTHKYQQAGGYSVNVTAQNHISSVSSKHVQINMIQKVANLTSIICQGPNLITHPITFRALYWFGTNLTFQWDFGDGSNTLLTTSSTVQHVYKEVGEYWVTVNAWNKFSHVNLSTNMFFLHDMCRKPEVTFLHQRNRVARCDQDVLIEADISILCRNSNVDYIWIIKDADNSTINFGMNITRNQRQLILPNGLLEPGKYYIELKMKMIGTIVYADSSTSLTVVQASPFISIKGGFVRWMGVNDTKELIADFKHFQHTQHINYIWSCSPLTQKHIPCFKDPKFLLNFGNSSKMLIPSSILTPNLGAVIINITDETDKLISSSQVLEITHLPHMLNVDIECDKCTNHHVNQQDRIQFKAVCKNCGNGTLEYHWKIWVINDGKPRMHFSNYLCVQADGSTFYIVAPNSTVENSSLNTTSPQIDNTVSFNTSNEHMLSEKPHEDITEDLPPFPILPGFPEINATNQAHNLLRTAREAPIDYPLDFPNSVPYSDYPFEGDAQYDDNSTFEDFAYSDFLPFPDFSLDDPDFLITEEGLPGEGGSAAARNQGSPNFGVISEDDDDILEETGKPRMKSPGSTVLVDGPSVSIDPLRDRLNRKPSTPHIVSRSRSGLHLQGEDTATGLNAEYLVLKPGVLKIAKSYLIQTKVINSATNEEGFAMEYLKVNVGPVNGRCTLMPVEGYSISFDFRLHCLEWKSDHLPLYYELRYSTTENDPGHLVYFGLNGNVKFNLPTGSSSNSSNVYLDVLVRDSLGASTKVCSLVKKVHPFQSNVSVENYVFNETFHPGATLKKFLGEKHNQAVLQKLHVLMFSINSFNDSADVDNKEFHSMRSKIKQEFLEIINSLQISNKIEATQVVSVLKEIISCSKTTNAFELQKVYNLYKQIQSKKLMLFDFFAKDHFQLQNVLFLSKLAYAAYSVLPRSEELIDIARRDLTEELKDTLKQRLQIEKPHRINTPHLSATALFVSNDMLIRGTLIPLKKVKIQFLDNQLSVSRDSNLTNNCLMFFGYEYSYVTFSKALDLPEQTVLPQTSVYYTFESCDNQNIIEADLHSNISINFLRPNGFLNSQQIPLKANDINVHIFNLTEKLVGQSFLFYIQFSEENKTNTDVAIDVIFRFKDYPTMNDYDVKRSFTTISSEINVFLPPYKLKDIGLYYISVIINKSLDEKNNPEDVFWIYEAFAWTDVCLGNSGGLWSNLNCQVAETTNSNSTHCLCSVQEVASYSTPLQWQLIVVPSSNFVEPYLNSLSVSILLILHVVFFLLLYLNYQRDKRIFRSYTPVSLKSNNLKHKQFYLLVVKTGFFYNSGTTASVFVVLHGTKDVTETRQLVGGDTKKFSFQKGSVNAFILSTEKNLGPLLKVEVWHNNKGSSPSWYLKTITIQDLKTDILYHFECFKWLSAETANYLVERELTVAESKPKFLKIFYENFITFIYDLTIWNSFVTDSPASFFTGVQRITCCFCFIFNCALLLILLQEEIDEESLPPITYKLYFTSFLVALCATMPQVIFTILFKFSAHPTININPKFRDFFHWITPYNFNCWLRPKRSNSSPSTTGSSSSVEGSDSLYSSFEDTSSIISVPDSPNESLCERERDILHLSTSFLDLSDAVSPLQKTLSTWQTLENWLRRKQDTILKPDSTQSQRQFTMFKSNSISLEERSFFNMDPNNSVNRSSNALHSSMSTVTSQYTSDDNLAKDSRILLKNKTLDLSFHFPIFPSYFYFLGWGMVIINLGVIYIPVIQKIFRFPLPFSIMYFKEVLISIMFSSLVITPSNILIIAIIYSISVYAQNCKESSSLELKDLLKEKKHNKHYNVTSSWRLEYFKKYLRPPKEQILQQFRYFTLREKTVSAFYRDLCTHVIVLILLLASVIPGCIQTKYLQRKSIENALFQSVPQCLKFLHTKQALLDWLEIDFLDKFLAEHHCHSTEEECGLSTQSILVGNVIMRHFYESFSSNYQVSHEHIYRGLYEQRLLKGSIKAYSIDSEWHILSDESFYAYDELHSFVDKINASSAASLEFLLFNPTFSLFTSFSILFEATHAGATAVTYEIVPMEFFSETHYFCRLFINSLFFLCILFTCKNQVWKMLKHKLEYWKQCSNYLHCFFILTYFFYLASFILHNIAYEAISTKLINTQLKVNVNITDIVTYETCVSCFGGLLISIHMLQFIKILCYNISISTKVKRLFILCKNMFPALTVFITLLLSIILINHFVCIHFPFRFPIFGFAEVIDICLKDYCQPEIQNHQSLFTTIFYFIIVVLLVFFHLYIFTLVKSVLMNTKIIGGSKNEGLSLKLTAKVLKKKLLPHLYLGEPHTSSCEDYVPPVDFLLYELERLADALVSKAESLFPEQNEKFSNIETYLVTECEKRLLRDSKLKQSSVDYLNRTFDDFLDDELGVVFGPERAASPLLKPGLNTQTAYVPSCFHSSLKCDRKFKTPESPASVKPNRIRKTYPLYHFDSDSSSSFTALDNIAEQSSCKALSIRRTKSRGKFKSEHFCLSSEVKNDELE